MTHKIDDIKNSCEKYTSWSNSRFSNNKLF